MLNCILSFSQDSKVADSLLLIYNKEQLLGINKLELLLDLSFNTANNDEALNFANELIKSSHSLNNDLFLYKGYSLRGQIYQRIGDLPATLKDYIKASEIASKIKNKKYEGATIILIAGLYSQMGNTPLSRKYYDEGISILRETKISLTLASGLLNAGDLEFNTGNHNAAIKFFKEAQSLFQQLNYESGIAYSYGNFGKVYAAQGRYELAEQELNKCLKILEEQEDYYGISDYLKSMSEIYIKRKEYPIAISYAQRSVKLAQEYNLVEQLSSTNAILAQLYEDINQKDLALKYYKDHITYRDSLINLKNVQEAADLRTNFEVSQKQNEVNLLTQTKKNQRLISFGIGILTLLLGIIALLWYRRYLFSQKTNQIIKGERDRANQAFSELKSTQEQLIQQEKLASLGQLTSGIAHEMKNPLNFINNFADLSSELIQEALDEIEKSNKDNHIDEALEILSDVKVNIKKILEHGKRVDTIVNTMLLHAKPGNINNQNTAINDLIKNYIHICYQGMQVSKNPIDVKIEMDLEENLPNVLLNMEEFSRVIINLCNNAFDAMKTKKAKIGQYTPVLSIKTLMKNNFLSLAIQDNGCGISDAIKDKIFQPFFTTKQGNEGTGLGLSVTHEIIRRHGFELIVDSEEGIGTEFIIKIPC